MRRIKALSPKTTTLLGGANCEGEMAEGILSLSDAVDHVFSGESEASFAAFLQTKGQERPRIYLGKPVQALDELPTPTTVTTTRSSPPSCRAACCSAMAWSV